MATPSFLCVPLFLGALIHAVHRSIFQNIFAENNSMHWSIEPFEECYNSIRKFGSVDQNLLENISEDLLSLLIHPGRNDKSKSQLINENEPITFSNGDQYRLNREFIDVSGVLAAELDLDEIATAELLWYANKLSFNNGTSFIDSGRYAYFTRAQYILNILGYLTLQEELGMVVKDYQKFLDNVLQSFKIIYSHVSTLNELIDKQKVTGDINNLQFTSAIAYLRSNLFKFHELLGELLFGLFSRYFAHYNTSQHFTKNIDHIKQNVADEDVLIFHYLPALFSFVNHLDKIKDVDQLHRSITSKLNQDYLKLSSADEVRISNSNLKGFEVLIYMFFFIYFITWCKSLDERIRKFDFKEDCLKYIEIVISYGAAEKLLCCTADSAHPKTTELIEMKNLYDFRSLLQKVFPRFTSVKFAYPNQDLQSIVSANPELTNINALLVTYSVSDEFNENLLAPFYHEFFREFVNNAAIVMTLLRDNEEDFLLSSLNKQLLDDPNAASKKANSNDFAGVDLDEIAEVADLERLYLAFSYSYLHRPELCAMLWVDEELSPDIVGFINWGLSYNTSPLIASTFCLLLGSITYAGPSSAVKVWDLLVSNNNASLKKNDYSKISLDSIVDSLEYYIGALFENFENDLNEQLKQQQKRQDYMFSANFASESDSRNITIELAEDSIVFISGFVQLISLIVRNISSYPAASTLLASDSSNLKNTIFNRFLPLITDFLKFDNTIMGIKNSTGDNKIYEGSITVNTETRVVLINLMLNFLEDFVHANDDLTLRYQIWNLIDKWFCHALAEKENQSNGFLNNNVKRSRVKLVRIEDGFHMNLSHISQVNNFVDLLILLLKPLHNNHQAFITYKLLYPPDLGDGHRPQDHIGIWPYMEYLLVEVFGKSTQVDEKFRILLQLKLVKLMELSLNEIDWQFLAVVAPKLIRNYDISSIFDTSYAPLDFQLFAKLHHSIAILHYTYEDSVTRSLFSIVDTGIEGLNSSPKSETLVENCLKVADKILLLQDFYVGQALPVLRDTAKPPTSSHTSMSLVAASNNIYDRVSLPQNLGNGVVDFFQVFLFNLSSVATLALYVGSDSIPIAKVSLEILKKLASSQFFDGQSGAENLTDSNRLLTIFKSVDESDRIKFGFIQQLQKDTESIEILELKLQILNFLIDNLQLHRMSVSHFLLGFKSQGGIIHLDPSDEHNTLLKSLLVSLDTFFRSMAELDYQNGNRHVIDVGSTTLVSLIMDLIANLCRHPQTSSTTLSYIKGLVNVDIFRVSVEAQPVVDVRTIWFDTEFDGELHERLQNKFIQSNLAVGSFFAFIKQRNLVFQLLALDMLNFSDNSSLMKKKAYKQLLLAGQNTLNGAPKLLSFLDVLNYEFSDFGDLKVETYSQKYDLKYFFELLQNKPSGLGRAVDLSVIEKTFMLLCRNQSDSILSDLTKESISQLIITEGNYLADYMTKLVFSRELEDLQVSCLHSWSQLVQALLLDDSMESSERINFIMEVFQIILPKINDSYDTRIRFCEELISLCVPLFEVFDTDQSKKEDVEERIHKSIPLLLTCIKGITSSTSTPELRSDLYVLSTKYLQQVMGHETLELVTKNLVKSNDTRLLATVCNDAICAEGAPRITSLLFLESLIHLASNCKDDFAMETILKTNSLVLLVHSLKRTDEVITEFLKDGSLNMHMGVESLVYELISFKTMLYVFLRIAQTRTGASQLVQNDIFTIFKLLKFISIDPDLGMDLRLRPQGDGNKFELNFSLDHNLTFSGDPDDGISYFEFLIPAFQVINAILLAMGPSYKPTVIQAKDLMRHFRVLIVGVLKRDVLLAEKKKTNYTAGLHQLIELFTLLDTLVTQSEE